MTEEERAALAALRFNWTSAPDDVWRSSPFHVEGLHRAVVQDVELALSDVRDSVDTSPVGLVLQGQRGSGKTHLLGWIRGQIHDQGGYFCLVSLLDAKSFWESVLDALLESLARPVAGRDSQLRLLLRRLSALAGVPRAARRAIVGEVELTRPDLDAFIDSLQAYDAHGTQESQDIARALALSASINAGHRGVAEDVFAPSNQSPSDGWVTWGIRRSPRTAQQLVRGMSRLLALTGPTVIAVDQIDTLVVQSVISADVAHAGAGGANGREQVLLLESIGGGLMDLHDFTRRTLTVVACFPTTWAMITSKATDTFQDRFRETAQLRTIRDADIARMIIEKRFADRFDRVGFKPRYRSWPVLPTAFADARHFTPRELLISIDEHVRACLLAGEIRELSHLGDPVQDRRSTAVLPPSIGARDRDRYDAQFDQLKREADIVSPLDPRTEDALFPELLAAGMAAWIIERGDESEAFVQDPPPSTNPSLHARLRLILDEDTEDQVHWCFRAVTDEHQAIAALHRLRRAKLAAGLDEEVTKRRLFLLRNGEWKGKVTRQTLEEVEKAGGRTLKIDNEDLRTLHALKEMLTESSPELHAWLLMRRPTRGIAFLQEAFADDPWVRAEATPGRRATAAGPAKPSGRAKASTRAKRPGPAKPLGQERPSGRAMPSMPATSPQPTESSKPATFAPAVETAAEPAGSSAPPADSPERPTLPIGWTLPGDAPVHLDLEALRTHVAIFAGSGSGKTVLIRRIVEQCALQGVSSIVLDPNNDLARLGDPWPAPPEQWGSDDAARATEYLAHTEVIVWTPRREAGRPLAFQPLPDFRSVLDDKDEFAEAVDAAVAALAPRAKLTGRSKAAQLGLAVLRNALEFHARHGAGGLRDLVELLADLPPRASALVGAAKIAVELSRSLAAAMVIDPLLGGDGTPMDPGVLLEPRPGKRARISVISLVGLSTEEERQGFVNQLQMAVFAWIKKHPVGDRPLQGLFVMDEAQTLAPAGAMTACTQSTIALASQARKYGLGLVFATQAPKGLHNQIPGNAATQFFGLLNSPIQIEAAREMARAKGGDVPYISRLKSGEFYLASLGSIPEKIRTPLCLSYHPRSPLTAEEVIERARDSIA